jgi:hypothetical protein
MVKCGVPFGVRTEFWNGIYMSFSFKGLNWMKLIYSMDNFNNVPALPLSKINLKRCKFCFMELTFQYTAGQCFSTFPALRTPFPKLFHAVSLNRIQSNQNVDRRYSYFCHVLHQSGSIKWWKKLKTYSSTILKNNKKYATLKLQTPEAQPSEA